MREELINELKEITAEEEQILSGSSEINKNIYMSAKPDVVDATKLLESGKLISVRTHTRFVHFPKHSHNYIELIYMCKGSTHHVINDKDVILREGELLFLNQNAIQEIYPAGLEDIAVNFIILPEFFDYGLKMMEAEKNLVRDFVIDCLRGSSKETASYLHFKVSDVLPIQNLVENLIWTIRNKQPNKRSINQATMGLLFLQLMNYTDKLDSRTDGSQSGVILGVLSFIEEHYKDGKLCDLAKAMNYDLVWLSKEIKKRTGKTYTELVQTKRLNQAAYLLRNTAMSVMDVGLAVGYDNLSYFHRIFYKCYGLTPRNYRIGK